MYFHHLEPTGWLGLTATQGPECMAWIDQAAQDCCQTFQLLHVQQQGELLPDLHTTRSGQWRWMMCHSHRSTKIFPFWHLRNSNISVYAPGFKLQVFNEWLRNAKNMNDQPRRDLTIQFAWFHWQSGMVMSKSKWGSSPVPRKGRHTKCALKLQGSTSILTRVGSCWLSWVHGFASLPWHCPPCGDPFLKNLKDLPRISWDFTVKAKSSNMFQSLIVRMDL